MSTLKPGLYKATVRGVPDTIVMIDDEGMGHHQENIDTLHRKHEHSANFTDARPLIVLDLKDPALMIKAMRSVIEASTKAYTAAGFGDTANVLELINQIEAQLPKPPRIEEPGQWGVVLADDILDHWIHDRVSGDRQWVCLNTRRRAEWANLINPVQIHDGIES